MTQQCERKNGKHLGCFKALYQYEEYLFQSAIFWSFNELLMEDRTARWAHVLRQVIMILERVKWRMWKKWCRALRSLLLSPIICNYFAGGLNNAVNHFFAMEVAIL